MSDSTGSQHTIPLLNGNELENDSSKLEARKKHHARLTWLIGLLRKIDDVDSKIYDVVHNIVDRDFLIDTPPHEPEDIAEIIGQFFQTEEMLFPGFLRKTPLPYRMLRLTLFLYKMSPISDHQISIIRMSDAEKQQKGPNQLLWFQFLADPTPSKIEANLLAYRQSRNDSTASYSHREFTTRSLQIMEDKILTTHRHYDVQVPSRRYEPSGVRANNDE